MNLEKENAIFVVGTNFHWRNDTRFYEKKENANMGIVQPCRIKLVWFKLKEDILKLHDMCPKSKCKCKKRNNFTREQIDLKGNGFKNERKKFKRTEKAWNKFLKPAVNVAASIIGMAVGAKIKNQKVGQATASTLKSISRVKVLSLTDMHGNGLTLKVMYIILNKLL